MAVSRGADLAINSQQSKIGNDIGARAGIRTPNRQIMRARYLALIPPPALK